MVNRGHNFISVAGTSDSAKLYAMVVAKIPDSKESGGVDVRSGRLSGRVLVSFDSQIVLRGLRLNSGNGLM